MGFLYIITNPNFPGWVKVGTTTNFKARLQSYQTSSPFRDYKVEFLLEHPEYLKAENRIKETMRMFCVDKKHEWYNVNIEIAKQRLEEDLDSFNNPQDCPVRQIIKRGYECTSRE